MYDANKTNQDWRGFGAMVPFSSLIWNVLLIKTVCPHVPVTLACFSTRGPAAISGNPQRCPSESCQRETSDTSPGTCPLCPAGPSVGEIMAGDINIDRVVPTNGQ